ncbi:MAG: hypothetical protein ACP5OA_00860 [Candidatus Woesearchaeota archaeon]
MKKRGQVTVYIILGLVILIVIGLYFYLRESTVNPVIDIPRLAGDAGLVQEFVEGCIGQVAATGLIELGRHGGYIDPTDMKYTLTTFDYDLIDQSESDLAFLNSYDVDSGVPYWYYSKSGRSCWHCEISTLSPSIQLMAYQLGMYVDEHIGECLSDYDTFKEMGLEIVNISGAKTTATINEKNVGFMTEYTIHVIRDEETFKIERFYKEVDIPLLEYYNIAAEITQSEIDTEYLDFYGLYLLGQHMGMDSKMLPPFGAYASGYDTVFWSKTNTKNLYESLLLSYTPFFRITGSSNEINYTLEGMPLELKMYNAMNLPIFTDEKRISLDLKNKEINHIYTGQKIYLNVRPSIGDLISPFVTQADSDLTSVVGSIEPDQSYEFYYDISYPMIVEVRDSRPGKEYSFMFALQGNIKENKLLSDWVKGLGTIQWSNDYVYTYSDIPIGTETEDVTTGEIYTYEVPQVSKTLFCDDEQRLSGNIRVKTYDSYTGMPLDGVQVSYYCGAYASCYISDTKYNSTLDEALLNAKFPLCMNGYVQLYKDGYLSKRLPLTTEYQRSSYIGSVYLDRTYTKNVTVWKYKILFNITGYVLDMPINLSVNDSVMISLTKITVDDWDEPWTQTLILGKDSSEEVNVTLVPGMYILDAQLMDYNGVVIPKECQEIKIPLKKNEWIPEENISIPVAMWGGIQFNERNPLVITSEDLINSQTIQFNIVRMPDPKCLNDMNVIERVERLSRNYRTELYPKFY